MQTKYSILWIEDSSRYDLANLAAPVYMDGKYDLVLAEDVSEGIRYLTQLSHSTDQFDVIILDIRLPPGNHKEWIELYKEHGFSKLSARLGRHLLYTLLGSKEARIQLSDKFNKIDASKVGILTVESFNELKVDLNTLQIKEYQYKQKQSDASETLLLELIEKILTPSEDAGE